MKTITTDETMRAVVVENFGGPEVLVPRELRRPEPGPGQVLIRVAYCGVCRHDLLTRSGAFPSISLPITLGHQVSGRIAELGEGVSNLSVSQRVITMIYQSCGDCMNCDEGNTALCTTHRPQFLGEDFDGGYAEYVLVNEKMILPVEDGLPLEHAAVITCTYGTAYHALLTRGRASTQQIVLVTGASGGVGLHLLQLARHLGITVIAVTSSPNKQDLLRKFGASEVIVNRDGKFAAAVKKATGGRGVDLVMEIVGGASLGESVHAVRNGGAIVLIGNIEGQPASIKPAHFILKEISLIGTKSCTHDEVGEVCKLITDDHLGVEVDGIFPLDEAAKVHRMMEDGSSHGRFVLQVNGDIT